MLFSEAELKKYLKRINIDQKPELSKEFLSKLHKKHLLSIPFENLSIHHNEKISLNKNYFFNKIIEKKRGGFCYELNGIFYLLLKTIGFDAKMVSAQVANAKGIYGPPFDHMAIIVSVKDEIFLADVGFGDSFTEPLIFKLNLVQKQNNKFYKIVKIKKDIYKYLESENGKIYKVKYIFDLDKRELVDFTEMCNYHQTSQESPFTQKMVCTIPVEDGRITLSDEKLIVTKNGDKKEYPFKQSDDFYKHLKNHFNITLT